MVHDPGARRAALADSLDGLSVGDALGERFFGWAHDAADLRRGWLPEAPWRWTDDTCMAATLAVHVVGFDGVDQDRLALAWARDLQPGRGYGRGARELLERISLGVPWQQASRELFDGGSFGNGSAMRVAPLGAWHLGDLAAAAHDGARQAEVTHAHPWGVAGGTVVAVVASYLAGLRLTGTAPSPDDVVRTAIEHCPPGEQLERLHHALRLRDASPAEAALALGAGYDVACHDTVPFCVWVTAHHVVDYPAAIAATVVGRGDVDTTCAIVGGLVASFTGVEGRDGVVGIPPSWLAAREPLPFDAARLRG
jgi:ADP-ribosylglycohydrolase